MRRRGAIKPGYIIVAFLVISAIFIPYAIGQSRVADNNKTLQNIYKFGDRVLNYIKDRNITKLQSEIMLNGHQIDLEDVALFLETVSLDSTQASAGWKGYKADDNNITIFGSIKYNDNAKRVNIMLIKKGNKLLVKAIHIGSSELNSSDRGFPLNEKEIDFIDSLSENNVSSY